MSALATILADRNHPVSGSDPRENSTVEQLRDQGIKVYSEQVSGTVEALLQATDGKPIVVISTAIPDTNAELKMCCCCPKRSNCMLYSYNRISCGFNNYLNIIMIN